VSGVKTFPAPISDVLPVSIPGTYARGHSPIISMSKGYIRYLFGMLGKSRGGFVKVMQMQHWMPNEFGPPFCMREHPQARSMPLTWQQ